MPDNAGPAWGQDTGQPKAADGFCCRQFEQHRLAQCGGIEPDVEFPCHVHRLLLV